MAVDPKVYEARESVGWFGIIGILFLFPIMFFLCVFAPIWLGWTPVP